MQNDGGTSRTEAPRTRARMRLSPVQSRHRGLPPPTVASPPEVVFFPDDGHRRDGRVVPATRPRAPRSRRHTRAKPPWRSSAIATLVRRPEYRRLSKWPGIKTDASRVRRLSEQGRQIVVTTIRTQHRRRGRASGRSELRRAAGSRVGKWKDPVCRRGVRRLRSLALTQPGSESSSR